MAEQEQQKPSTPVQVDTSPVPAEAKAPGWRGSPQPVPALHGLQWIADAGRLLAGQPVLWLGAFTLAALLAFAASILLAGEEGVFRSLLPLICWPTLTGGIARAAYKQRQGASAGLRDVFAFFRSGLLCLGWTGVGFFVTHLMFFLLIFLFFFLALLARSLSALLGFSVVCAALILAGTALIMGNLFLAAAVALNDDLTLKAVFHAGGQNSPAFLLNALALSPVVFGLCWASLLFPQHVPGLETWHFYTPDLGICHLFVLLLTLFTGLAALIAYAAARDIFYQEQGAAPAKHAAWPAQEPRNPQDSSC